MNKVNILQELNFQKFFESVSEAYMVLTPEFIITAVTDSYVRKSLKKKEELIGLYLFDVFPDNPDDPNVNGFNNLTVSLNIVLAEKVPHIMDIIKYDIPLPAGGFETKYWKVENSPIFNENGEVSYILHKPEDVTELVLLKEKKNEAALKIQSNIMEEEIKHITLNLSIANNEAEYQRNKLYSLLMNAPACICLLESSEHIFSFMNPSYQKLLGNRNLLGKKVRESVPEVAGQGFIELLDNVYSTGKPFIGNEISLKIDKTGDGILSQTYLNFVYQPVFNFDNQVEGISVLAYEVTEQILARKEVEKLNQELSESETRYKALSKELEIKVQERTEKLIQANEELRISYGELANQNENLKTLQEALLNRQEDLVSKEIELTRSNQTLNQFANMASHDLKEPLRMIRQYVTILAKRYKDKLDKDANDFIGYTVDGVERMEHLIKSILDYAKLNKLGIPIESTYSQISLDRARMNLSVAIEESRAVITNDELPSLHVNSVQLTQVFQNLLSNALKYRSKDNLVKIHIGVEKKDNRWFFSVSDNGIGIKSEDFKRIFLPFHRLHSNSEYEGIGLGLSFCKKTVEQYGGDMWVESELGKGTTFFFTIMEF
ncbi:MAG: PAS domain-containing protein [Candidatus Sericytochromatia bacterium]|nr:PAS domain-containing protein [Candidatus Sericytochromatia bacterium]